MAKSMAERLVAALRELSPAERAVAQHLVDHPDDLLVLSAAELARRTGTSKATVSRSLRSLGWRDAQSARDALLAERRPGVPIGAVQRSSDELEERNIADGLASLEALGAGNVARNLANARRVLVLGFRNSFPLALHFRTQLAQIRDQTTLAPAPGQSLAEELIGLGPKDAVVVLGFQRRSRGFSELLNVLAGLGVFRLVIADPSLSVSSEVPVVHCPIEGPGAFQSYAAAMAVLARIAADVSVVRGAQGAERALAVAELYERLGELDDLGR